MEVASHLFVGSSLLGLIGAVKKAVPVPPAAPSVILGLSAAPSAARDLPFISTSAVGGVAPALTCPALCSRGGSCSTELSATSEIPLSSLSCRRVVPVRAPLTRAATRAEPVVAAMIDGATATGDTAARIALTPSKCGAVTGEVAGEPLSAGVREGGRPCPESKGAAKATTQHNKTWRRRSDQNGILAGWLGRLRGENGSNMLIVFGCALSVCAAAQRSV